MASIIRAPRMNEKPRRLKGDEVLVQPMPAETAGQVDVDAAPQIAEEHEFPPVRESRPERTPNMPLISPGELSDLQRRLREAESRAEVAEQKLEEMQGDIERLRIEAKEQGFVVGYEESGKKLEAEYQQQQESIKLILQSLSEQLESLVLHAEDSIVETVYAAVLKILGDKLTSRDSIVAVVRHVAGQLIRPEFFTVRLAPADYELIAEHRDRIFDENAAVSVKVVPDARIELGGCILESGNGSLDARLEIQLKRFKEVLLDNRARRQIDLEGAQ